MLGVSGDALSFALSFRDQPASLPRRLRVKRPRRRALPHPAFRLRTGGHLLPSAVVSATPFPPQSRHAAPHPNFTRRPAFDWDEGRADYPLSSLHSLSK